jgi:hypothetical protein
VTPLAPVIASDGKQSAQQREYTAPTRRSWRLCVCECCYVGDIRRGKRVMAMLWEMQGGWERNSTFVASESVFGCRAQSMGRCGDKHSVPLTNFTCHTITKTRDNNLSRGKRRISTGWGTICECNHGRLEFPKCSLSKLIEVEAIRPNSGLPENILIQNVGHPVNSTRAQLGWSIIRPPTITN